MSSIDEQVGSLRARVEAATRMKARAEAGRDAARNAADTVKKELADRYGVRSVEDAKTLAAKMQSELNELVTRARQSLDDLNL